MPNHGAGHPVPDAIKQLAIDLHMRYQIQDRAIAERLGMSTKTVSDLISAYRRTHGLPLRNGRKVVKK